VDVDDVSIQDCNTGLYTDNVSTGSYDDVKITGGSAGLIAKSSGTHTFRSGMIRDFLQTAISTNQSSGLDFGTSGNAGLNNVTTTLSAGDTLKYFKVKPYISGLPDLPAIGNWWGQYPPPADQFCLGVDYLPARQDSVPISGVEIMMVPVTLKPAFFAAPNPFHNDLSFVFRVPEGTTGYELEIFDINGRVVQRWQESALPGEHAIEWDGRSYTGERVASGVYFGRYRSGKMLKTVKVVRLPR